ncbi:MAG: PQQ-binding-like beta-propeller repeat protein [Pirellulales bacterium]
MRFWLAVLAIIAPQSARSENWPQWRGPQSDGISSEKGIPTEWGREKNVVWRVALPGPAGATPVVWEDRIFLTTTEAAKVDMICISTDGKQLWRETIGEGSQNVREDEGNYASPSPATDGERVIGFMGTGDLACFDMDGKVVWRLDINEKYGPLNIQFGMASTPVLDNGRLYLQLIHGDGDPETEEARIVCLDAKTGNEIWQSKRLTNAKMECEHAYTSPFLYRFGDLEYLLTHGGDFTIAYDLGDGKELWRCGGMNPPAPGGYHDTFRMVASPGISEDLIVIPTAKNGPVLGVRPDGSGDITESDYFLWRMPQGTPDVSSPLILDGLVYLVGERGFLTCVDAKTGKEIYRERTIDARHRASPVYVDGKIIIPSRNGNIMVVAPGREFKVLAINDIEEEISASPVVSNGMLYLRTFDALYAIGE